MIVETPVPKSRIGGLGEELICRSFDRGYHCGEQTDLYDLPSQQHALEVLLAELHSTGYRRINKLMPLVGVISVE